MEHIAPLIQTVLWVGLIAGTLWRFHSSLYGLLETLQKRIESGSNIKAGPFELTGQLKPQDPLQQKEKGAIEAQGVLQEAPEVAQNNIQAITPQSIATIQAKYFQAEDLVLRALQAEYGATVSRQVTAGADMGFDGVFVTNGRLNIVEVKYVRSIASSVSKLRMAIDRIAEATVRYGWRNAQIILAVVLENDEDVSKASVRLQELSSTSSVPVVVRCYSFNELQQKFGVAAQQRG